MQSDLRKVLMVWSSRNWETGLIVGRELKVASAVGFVKACLDVTQSEESLVLAAKAILAARLALNTLPKVHLRISRLIVEFTIIFSNSARSVFKSASDITETN